MNFVRRDGSRPTRLELWNNLRIELLANTPSCEGRHDARILYNGRYTIWEVEYNKCIVCFKDVDWVHISAICNVCIDAMKGLEKRLISDV